MNDIVAPPLTVVMSTFPLLSCSVRSPRTLRTSTPPKELIIDAGPVSLTTMAPLPPVMLAAPCTLRTVILPNRLRTSSAPLISEACTEPLLSLIEVSPDAPARSTLPKELLRRAGPESRTVSEP